MSIREKKAITTTLPLEEFVAVDRVCRREKLSRSALLRVAIRQYVAGARHRIRAVDPEPGELEAIARGEAAIARGEYVTLEELLDDLGHDRRAGGAKKPQTIS
jgi:predicted transcriptional regulator